MQREQLVIVLATTYAIFLTIFCSARIVDAIKGLRNSMEELSKAIDDRKGRMEDYASLVHKSSEYLLPISSWKVLYRWTSYVDVHKNLKDMLGMLESFSEYMSEAAKRRKGMWSYFVCIES
jgi:hypothetical protein